MIFNNSKIYDFLKWLALVALDAIGVAYEALAGVWSLPFGGEVAKTCTIISVLIGTLIGISSIKNQNTFEVEDLDSEYKEDE